MATAAVYLEQYLDSLDSLPDEMKEKFEAMRELDEKVMEEHKKAESKKLALFKDLKCVKKMEDNEKKKRITEIQTLYRNCNSISEQKCQLASQAYELIDKHIQKLDVELARFEGELKQQQLENLSGANSTSGSAAHTNRHNNDQQLNKSNSSNSMSGGGKLGNTGGRKTKMSGSSSHNSNKSHNSHAPNSSNDASGKKKRKLEANTSSVNTESNTNQASRKTNSSSLNSSGGLNAPAILGLPEIIGGSVDVLDMPVDPNEPTYCICQQVSYGEMIGCDNPDCPVEWFHFNCVGLSTKPKGKWFCGKCSLERKKKLTTCSSL